MDDKVGLTSKTFDELCDIYKRSKDGNISDDEKKELEILFKTSCIDTRLLINSLEKGAKK